MKLEEFEDIPAINIALEIILNNMKTPMYTQLIIITIFQLLIPVIIAYIEEKDTFINNYDQTIYWLHFPCRFMLYLFNLVLFNSMNILMFHKMKYMQTLFTMLDNTHRDFYGLEFEMP